MGKLEGRVSIVTGGGSGIGFAIARAYTEEGSVVVIADCSEESGSAAAKNINETGGRSIFVRTDVSRWADMDHLVSETVRHFGKLDIMVNNAGVLDGYVTCLETSEELFDRILAINLKGVFFGCKRALTEMVKAGYGKIINISSIAGLQSNAGGTPYTISKHGVIGLTRELAHEYGPKGIRVNAICPGSIAETNLRVTSKEVLGECSAGNMYAGPGTKPPEYLRELIPLGGRGVPKDIALAAVFLASLDSDYVNGHALVVDGGLVVR